MKRLLFTFLICGLTFTAFSQSNTKIDKIKTLLELTGSAKMGTQVVNSIITSFRNTHPNAPQEFWTVLEKKAKADDLITFIIPIYEKYYTEEDIDNLISFYKTPLGKKMVATAPLILQESMAVGQNLGKKMGDDIVKELKERSLIKE